jgi:SAM-dependent methyltransferase
MNLPRESAVHSFQDVEQLCSQERASKRFSCYICGGVTRSAVVQGGYTYFRCENCGSSQLNPIPSELALQEFYDRYHLSSELGGSYEGVESRMQADFPFKARLALRFATRTDSGGSPHLLDVGCGKGYFLKEALRIGMKGSGIDLSRSAVKFAGEVLGVDARAGRIEKDAPPEWMAAFDVATFWAAIEHLRDPLSVLQAISQCLKPGGVLLCDTGLGAAPWEGMLAGYNQWHDAPQHVFVFSRNGLLSLLDRAGFEVIQVDINSERNVIRRVVRSFRHAIVCLASFSIFRSLLGYAGFQAMKQTAKWPIGRLMFVVARKKRNVE